MNVFFHVRFSVGADRNGGWRLAKDRSPDRRGARSDTVGAFL